MITAGKVQPAAPIWAVLLKPMDPLSLLGWTACIQYVGAWTPYKRTRCSTISAAGEELPSETEKCTSPGMKQWKIEYLPKNEKLKKITTHGSRKKINKNMWKTKKGLRGQGLLSFSYSPEFQQPEAPLQFTGQVPACPQLRTRQMRGGKEPLCTWLNGSMNGWHCFLTN